MMKQCYTCKKLKPLTEFHSNCRKYDGLSIYCKDCVRLQRKDKHYHKWSRYRITQAQYNIILKQQKGVCAICGKPETAHDSRTKQIKPLVVDHDHKTNKFRELLCDNCNHILGNARDDIKILEKAIEYLRKHSCNH